MINIGRIIRFRNRVTLLAVTLKKGVDDSTDEITYDTHIALIISKPSKKNMVRIVIITSQVLGAEIYAW